jgi:vacuolar protein sorting-associated protein 13B
LNQIELVIVLNKELASADTFHAPSQHESPSDSVLLQQQPPTTAEQSNYVQTVLARILNNVQIIVNNLIVKFIEDDVVISLSSRTAQCFAVNQHWLKSFVELTTQDLSLRRLISLPDLTLCLDRRDSTGKVHRYEVPLLSRCSFECRIQMFYSNVYQQLNTKPIQTRLTFNCANIEVSLVDNQLSMIRRLTEHIMVLIHAQDSMEASTVEQQEKRVSPAKESTAAVPSTSSSLLPSSNSTMEHSPVTTDDAQAGWISWAWSYVPSVTTMFIEEEDLDETNATNTLAEQPVDTSAVSEQANLLSDNVTHPQSPTPLLLAGIDLDRISLQYKVKPSCLYSIEERFLVQITKTTGDKVVLIPFIGFIIEKASEFDLCQDERWLRSCQISSLSDTNRRVQQMMMVNRWCHVCAK